MYVLESEISVASQSSCQMKNTRVCVEIFSFFFLTTRVARCLNEQNMTKKCFIPKQCSMECICCVCF